MTIADETQPEKPDAAADATSESDGQPQESDGQPQESEAADRAPEDRTVEDWESLLEFQRTRAESNFNGWQRAQADYANHKRRADQERTDALKYGGAPVLGQALSIADDLDRALSALPATLARLTWIEGVVIIHRKLLAMLEVSGVQEIEAEGKEFDPNIHEAITQTDGPEGQVIKVVQKGYELYGRVLRPSLVQVGNGAVAIAEDGPEDHEDDAEPKETGSETTENRE